MIRAALFVIVACLPLAAGCATAVMNGMATGDDAAREDGYPTATQDARITRELRMQIYRDPLLGDERIRVSTAQGIVTLSGAVSSRTHANRAMELARGIEGVRGVKVELKLSNTL